MRNTDYGDSLSGVKVLDMRRQVCVILSSALRVLPFVKAASYICAILHTWLPYFHTILPLTQGV